MTGVLLADDHPLFRTALSTAVRRVRSDARILEASTLSGALDRLRETPAVDLVLLDLRMPDCDGFTGLLTLRAEFPAAPVVVVSASEDDETVRRALAFGASGFIPKSASLETMVEALETVLAGDAWAPAVPDPERDDAAAERIASLTPAQLRILVGLRRGRLNKQIAYEIGVTEATVKAHMTAIFRKLGVLNRTQAVIAAEALMLDSDAA
ncbi:response regulator [Phenylobacterium sp.]|uniref:response regulator transcription factor n=1 Tax=Phenylobacterium sp. TaxID=1871053 RepID=UPI0035B36D70